MDPLGTPVEGEHFGATGESKHYAGEEKPSQALFMGKVECLKL